MRLSLRFSLFICSLVPALSSAQILQLAQLNTTQVQALDRSHTVLLITNGILEEHGPFLPSFTDGYWDEALSQELARALVARAGWTVVMLPTVPLGTNPANVIARRWIFPGSFTIRQDTMRDVFMDLADSIGEQGFRYVIIVDSHGGPTNSLALDTASDYFHDTYHGEMVHLFGTQRIQNCCNTLEEMLTPKQVEQNGLPLHADALEQSQLLFVRPDLAPPGYKQAQINGSNDFSNLMQTSEKPGWPGYLGAPSYASAALGARNFRELSDALSKLSIEVLDGKTDPRKLPRYTEAILPMTSAVEQPLIEHEAQAAERHRHWLSTRTAATITKP